MPLPDAPSGDRSPQGFRYLGEDVVFRGWRIDVVKARFEAPDGEQFDRDIVRHPGAVAVVAVTDRSSALLVRQYRGSLDRELLELPAGTMDVEGESSETAARRELEEEAGVTARHVRLLASTVNTPGFCDEVTELFLATGLGGVPHNRHGAEELAIEVVEVALAEVPAKIASGEIVDAQTIIGLLLARDVLDVASAAGEAAGGP